jgi:hypothetical protein
VWNGDDLFGDLALMQSWSGINVMTPDWQCLVNSLNGFSISYVEGDLEKWSPHPVILLYANNNTGAQM